MGIRSGPGKWLRLGVAVTAMGLAVGVMAPLAQDLPGRRTDQLRQRVRDSENFEAQLNAARRFQREEAFRIDVQLLDGIATPAEAATA